MIAFTHNPWLVLVSVAVALMAGFTGLSLTRGASALGVPRRKTIVAMAAVVLGGGIWSMHFVAMLGLQLPAPFYYDPLTTLISALLAILMVGLALLILHFRPRTPVTITLAGVIVGLGIVVMHYVGMTGMRLVKPVFGPADVGLSTLAAVALAVLSIWVAYDARTNRNILIATGCFGFAVGAAHFIAMAQTGFVALDTAAASGPLLSKEGLALGVTLAVFLLCAAFLLTGVTFIGQEAADADISPAARPEPAGTDLPAGVPFERDGQTHFAPREAIAAIRAEGHYTLLYVNDEKLFCPWSITDAEQRLGAAGFLRAHRSYLINPSHVSGFERTKDSGACYFEQVGSLAKVPVSRSRLGDVRLALGL